LSIRGRSAKTYLPHWFRLLPLINFRPRMPFKAAGIHASPCIPAVHATFLWQIMNDQMNDHTLSLASSYFNKLPFAMSNYHTAYPSKMPFHISILIATPRHIDPSAYSPIVLAAQHGCTIIQIDAMMLPNIKPIFFAHCLPSQPKQLPAGRFELTAYKKRGEPSSPRPWIT